jgi:hypothetical protein
MWCVTLLVTLYLSAGLACNSGSKPSTCYSSNTKCQGLIRENGGLLLAHGGQSRKRRNLFENLTSFEQASCDVLNIVYQECYSHQDIPSTPNSTIHRVIYDGKGVL